MAEWPSLWLSVLTLSLTYLVYAYISRILLSPLKHIPGPQLAALTSWYEFYFDVIQPGQFVWKIADLHQKYGPIVRVTPWEVHVNDVEFLDTIYAPSYTRRNKYVYQTKTLPVPLSVGASWQHDVHRKRREALNPFFSKRSVQDLEPMIKAKTVLLCNQLEEHLQSGSPFNLSDASFAFSNDIVLQYSFGHDNDLLSDLERASELRKNLSELLLGVKINQHFPWIVNTLESLPTSLTKNMMPPGVLEMKAFAYRIQQEIQQMLDDNDDSKRGGKRSIFYELRDNPNLPPSEKSPLRLEHEGTLLIMAGTESTAKSIAITQYYLLANPKMMTNLRDELHTVSADASWTELEQLPYLSACIAEGNRLSFGVTARVCRIAPDETMHYQNIAIPPGTPVSMTTLCAHTDETVFPDPWTFNPDRWLGPEGRKRRKYQMAFNKGGRQCVGINLAHAEMFLVIAAMARYEMELFETGEEDVRFQHDYQVAFAKLGSKGIRAVVKGREQPER